MPFARAVQLDSKHRLPPAQDQLAILHHQGGEGAQKGLAAVSVSVDRLVERDVEAACEVVVLVARAGRSEALEQTLEIAQQQRLVFVDRDPDGGVQRLQVDAAVAQAAPAYLVADTVRDVDELRGVHGGEFEPPVAQLAAPSDCWRSCRVAGAGWCAAAAAATTSIARAKATWTASGAWSASSREPRARPRSPVHRVVGAAAPPPRPCTRTPTPMRAAARGRLRR